MAVLQIPLPKTKGFIEVDTSEEKMPADMYQQAVILGFKALLAQKGFSKFKMKDFRTDDEAIGEAKKIAQTNLEAIYGGSYKIRGTKATAKREGKERTEAIRLAKIVVKNQMKSLNIRAKDVKAADVTKAAKAIVDANEAHYLAAARESLAKAEIEAPSGLDLAKILGATPAPKTVRKPPAKKGTGGIPGAVATKTKPGGKPAHT